MPASNLKSINCIVSKIRLVFSIILILFCVAFCNKAEAKEKYGEFYEIDNGYVINILPETTYSDLKHNLENENIEVINQGKQIDLDQYVGSGMTLKDGNKTYTTAVIADIDGNGRLTISDLVKMRLYTANLISLDEKCKRAADVNNDGSISITDLVQVNLLVSKIKDRIAPESFTPEIAVTKDTIVIAGNTVDSGCLEVEYFFKIDNGNWVQNEDKSNGLYIFKDLNRKKSHTVRMKVKDKFGNEKKTEEYFVEAQIGNIEIIPNTFEWTNKDITVAVQCDTNIEDTKLMVSVDGGRSFKEYGDPLKISKNTKIVAQLENKYGEIIEEEELTILNIDKLSPKPFDVEIIPERRQIEVKALTEDEDATEEFGKSEIKEYEYIIKDGVWRWSTKTQDDRYTFRSLTPLQIYEIEVIAYDNAGNTYSVIRQGALDTTYTLTIDENEGIYDGEQVVEGEVDSVTRIEDPIRDGYEFIGWEIIGEGQIKTSSYIFGEGDALIRAIWEPIEYTITYQLLEDEVENNPNTYTVETPSFVLENPTRVGYTFVGWTGSNGFVPQKNVIIPTGSMGDKVYTANWALKEYTVTFIGIGTNNIPSYYQITANYGETIRMLVPTRKYKINYNTNGGNEISSDEVYYEFLGWYEDETYTTKAEFTTMPAQNKVLYARWNSTSIELPTPEKLGYTFGGWYKDADLINAVSLNFTPTNDITLYAKWNANEYTITFDANGGTATPNSITAEYETSITMPVAERSNTVTYNTNGGEQIENEIIYSEFLGWYTQIENGTRRKYNEMPAYNETLYAKWQIGKIELQIPEREGYTFEGWYKDSDLTQRIYTQLEVSEDITVYAKWQANKYDAIYEYNGATGRNVETGKKVEYQSPYGELANPERKYTVSYNTNGGSNIAPEEVSYEFLGWYKGDNNITSQTIVDTPLSHILNARWQANSIRLAETEKTGYTFDGWYENKTYSGTRYEANENYEPKSNVTMYAKWNVITYTIEYELNGGIDPINPQNYTVETDTFTLRNPVKEGYVFVGWLKQGEADTNYKEVIANGSIGNRVYTAVWAQRNDIPYIVEHQKQNIDGTYETVDIDYLTGSTNEIITPATKNYVGFTSPDTQILTINADGSTKVKYQYTRNKYQFTLETGTGTDTTGSSANGQYYFEETIELRMNLKPGYKDGQWLSDYFQTGILYVPQINITMPANDLTVASVAQAKVYQITYYLNGGEALNPVSYTIEDTSITLNNPTKVGYDFAGWTGSNGTTPEIDVVIPTGSTGSKEYTANWNPSSQTPYKVEHQLQNVTGSGYKTIEIESLTGRTGESITPATKNYVGFTSPDLQTVTISADGSTKVIYKYERERYQFTLGETTGVTTTGSTPSGSYYYGATIGLEAQTITGYENITWLSSNTSKVGNIQSEKGNFKMPNCDITMTPYVDEEVYEITYVLGGGSLPNGTSNPSTYTVSELPITLNNPERLGYEFIGWTGSNGTSYEKSVTIVNYGLGDKIFYANWKIVDYGITYVLNGGVDPENPTSFTIETETFTLKNPTKQGYDFVGWKKDDEQDSVYTVTIPKGSVNSRTYTAIWEPSTNTPYIVEHRQQALNGTYETIETENFVGTTDQSVTPAVKNYVGFISPSAQTITIRPDGQTRVIYKYERMKYQFTLGSAEGVITTGSTPSGIYYYGEIINLNAQTLPGFSNATWESSNQSKVANILSASGSFEMPDTSIAMTPSVIVEEYTIQYELDGGSVATANPTTYTAKTETFTLNNPQKLGYEFIGWTGSNGSSLQITVTIEKGSSGSRTYRANWTPRTDTPYTVIHKLQALDGSYVTEETENLRGTTGQRVTPAVKSYVGFTSPNTQTVTINANATTTVTYQYTRNKYQFTLGTATGVTTTGSTQSGNYYYGTVITLQAQSSTGYGNVTWESSVPNQIANIYNSSGSFTMPNCNIKMTPKAEENTYNIMFISNGGLGSMNGIENIKISQNVTIPSNGFTPPQGTSFKGWSLSPDGAVRYNAGDVVSGLTTQNGVTVALYAVWGVNTYTITYTLNGGRAVGNPTSYTINTNTFSLNAPTRDGYIFKGWTGSNGSTPQTTVTVQKGSTGNLSYTANWVEAVYSVTTGSTVTYHEYLQDAFSATSPTGSTVKALKNNTDTKSTDFSITNTSVTLNLNGKTINVFKTITIQANKQVTIIGSGTFETRMLENYGSLTLKNLTLKGYANTVQTHSGNVYINNSNITSTLLAGVCATDSATVYIDSGSISGEDYGILANDYAGITVGSSSATLSKTAPSVTGRTGYGILFGNNAKFNFYNGAIIGASAYTLGNKQVAFAITENTEINYRTGCFPVTAVSSNYVTTLSDEPEEVELHYTFSTYESNISWSRVDRAVGERSDSITYTHWNTSDIQNSNYATITFKNVPTDDGFYMSFVPTKNISSSNYWGFNSNGGIIDTVNNCLEVNNRGTKDIFIRFSGDGSYYIRQAVISNVQNSKDNPTIKYKLVRDS